MKSIKSILFILFIIVSGTGFAADAVKKSVEQVHKEKDALNDKQVIVTGKVVKVNNGIMKRNFLHIQDGSGGEGTNDLTITSNQTANVGDNVTITGTVKLNNDFGFGYAYPIIVEKSAIKLNKK